MAHTKQNAGFPGKDAGNGTQQGRRFPFLRVQERPDQALYRGCSDSGDGLPMAVAERTNASAPVDKSDAPQMITDTRTKGDARWLTKQNGSNR